MRYALVLALCLWFGAASASLVDNGSYTTDTASGLDWLDLDATDGMSWSEAPVAYDEWRYATNGEIEDIFAQLFDGYYDTDPNGTSYSIRGAYADQRADIQVFTDLFGATYYSPDTGEPVTSVGMYMDENGVITAIGTYVNEGPNVINEFNYVIGLEYTGDFTETETGNFGVFLVRSTVVPIPSALLLFVSALATIRWARRKTIAI